VSAELVYMALAGRCWVRVGMKSRDGPAPRCPAIKVQGGDLILLRKPASSSP
jgi:hypothetical protein